MKVVGRTLYVGRMRIKPFFAWYDLWTGFYWNRELKILYWCYLPMCCVLFKWETR